MPKVILTRRQKVHKWFRLVALLTLRKYGFFILAVLYYTFLLSAAVSSYDQVWTEYAKAEDCQYGFASNVSSMMSAAYDEASLALATAALDNTKCIMRTTDIDMPSPMPDIPLSELPDSVMLHLFGWIREPDIGIPDSKLVVNNTADSVVNNMQDYANMMSTVAKWVDYVGFGVVFITILIILCTSTHYTVRNKPWRPPKSRLCVILVDIVRAVLVYAVAMLVVYMQANSMDRACKIRMDDTQLLLPRCEVKAECGLSCVNEVHVFENTCPGCDIPLQWWWVDWDSLPNIFGALYILFLLTVYTLESVETRYQRRLAAQNQGTGSLGEDVVGKDRGNDMRSPLLP
ncbi:unnamed protein product [Ostreobium quekettii]|uniref:Transmembrane protein n=1 Tax=Ostreobium quekettii TaxID=121088 RepID=A0A8S1IPB5_9CHLO|nr:unnamed protein product [Ostreobium quekettii]|eukprot:evm.model.scf_223EXC.1 EVM.evm.TU.scf_223EXC.1   scf_223EXC:22862-25003(+)